MVPISLDLFADQGFPVVMVRLSRGNRELAEGEQPDGASAGDEKTLDTIQIHSVIPTLRFEASVASYSEGASPGGIRFSGLGPPGKSGKLKN
jgi:hypothetical protein